MCEKCQLIVAWLCLDVCIQPKNLELAFVTSNCSCLVASEFRIGIRPQYQPAFIVLTPFLPQYRAIPLRIGQNCPFLLRPRHTLPHARHLSPTPPPTRRLPLPRPFPSSSQPAARHPFRPSSRQAPAGAGAQPPLPFFLAAGSSRSSSQPAAAPPSCAVPPSLHLRRPTPAPLPLHRRDVATRRVPSSAGPPLRRPAPALPPA